MIFFSTIETSLNGISNKIAFFGKSIKNIQRDFSTGHNVITSIFAHSPTKQDITYIKEYCSQIESGTRHVAAWRNTMQNATVAGKQAALEIRNGKTTLDALQGSVNSSRLAMIGLTAATTVLNTALTIGLSWAISSVLNWFISSSQKAADAIKEAAQNAQKLKESFENIDDYKTKINELLTALNNDNISQSEATEKRKQLLSVQDELIKKYGNEKEVIDSITDAINGEVNALDELQVIAAKDYIKNNRKIIKEAHDYFNQTQVDNVDLGEFTEIQKTVTGYKRFTNVIKQLMPLSNPLDSDLQVFDNKANFKGTKDSLIRQYDELYDSIKQYMIDNPLDVAVNAYLSEFLDNISTKRNEIISDNQYQEKKDIYDAGVESVIISSNKYSQYYVELTKKQKAYTTALANGVEDEITKTSDSLTEFFARILSIDFSDEDNVAGDSIKLWFENARKQFIEQSSRNPITIKPQISTEKTFALSKEQAQEVNSIFSDIEKLNNAYNKLDEDKLIENDVRELVALFPELEEYVDYSADKFGNLAEGIDKVIKQRPVDLLEKLQDIDKSKLSEGSRKYLDSLINSLQGVHAELKKVDEFIEHIKKSIKGVSSSISTLIGFSKEIDENGVLSLSSIDTILADDTYASLRPYINDMENMKSAIASLTSTQKIAYEDLYNAEMYKDDVEAYHKAVQEKEKSDDNLLKNSIKRIDDEIKYFNDAYDIDVTNWDSLSDTKKNILQNTNAELLSKQNSLINEFANSYGVDLRNFAKAADAKQAVLDNLSKSKAIQDVYDYLNQNTELGGDWVAHTPVSAIPRNIQAEVEKILSPVGLTFEDWQHWVRGDHYDEIGDKIQKSIEQVINGFTITDTNWEQITANVKSTGSSSSSKNYIDWIERRLKKFAQTTKEVFARVADYISFNNQNSQLRKAINAIRDEIAANEKAYQAYMDEANALGLDSTWTWWLQNGGYSVQDISSFSDDLKDKVSRYKELYEKAIDCKNAIADLKKTEKEYAEQMLSNIDKYYDNRINRAKNSVDYYNSLDTDTQFIAKNYGGLADNYNKQISETQNKAKQLQETLSSLVSQGLIKEGSDEWYEWVSKIDQCTIQVRELTKSLHELAVEQFNNIKEQYDNQLKAIEYTSKQYDNKIKKLEGQGYMANLQHYAGLKSVQQQNITLLERQAKALQKSLDEAMENGDIQKYSKEWYSAKQAIDDVNNSIDEGKIKLIEYGNTMREIEWGYFDYLQDRISQVTDEADFLIDVISHSKLFDDNGNITAKGKSSIGLHAQNHNIYLAQAQQYATEIKSINKLLADDPNNKKLIERKEELLKLQQQSIQATQKEKKAIVDLVKEGIDLQLKSLKKLIDEYKSSLDNAKNLYEYQKKINDKTSDISKIQKQLMAYQGDNSEESRARIQKLQTDLKTAQEDLQETEYEQFISDTKSLLDNLYEDYEEYMNKRLDNQEQIWREMVGTVNQSTTEISAEIQKSANSIGYTLSKSITDIWSNPNSINKIVVANSTNFNERLSSINNVLGAINANVSSMVSASGGTFKKYATGGLIDYTGIAQVDGTPTKPELVLNANDTQNFLKFNDEIKRLSTVTRFSGYNFAGLPIPTPHISDISSVFGNIAKSSVSGNGSVNIEHFDIAIDKVQDYNDFVSQLRNDKKVERMIQDMTIGRINGNNSFTKHKYNW